MSMPWTLFAAAVKRDPYHGYGERCELLRTVASAFANHQDFASMERGLRSAIAGLPTDHDARWGWFGSMKGAGYFSKAVKDNNPHLSRALDCVPLRGQVTRSQYDAFLDEFVKAFPKGGDGVATATRLLALKRPDQFVCVDSKNQRALCQNFGIATTGMNYERYWNEVVDRVMDSPWWNSSRPSIEDERMVWDGRAAMLDAIFYRE